MKALVPEKGFKPIDGIGGNQKYLHKEEGVDDMPAHIKTALTSTSLSLSINQSKVVLGTWQAIYLWEHRYSTNIRRINLHAIGEVNLSKKIRNQRENELITKKDECIKTQ